MSVNNLLEKFKNLGKNQQYFLSIFLITFVVSLFTGVSYFFFNLTYSFFLSFFLYPFYFVIRDKRIDREKKVGWIIFIFFFNWIAFAFYLIKKKD